MDDTSGFYKLDVGNVLLFAPNCVYGTDFCLFRQDHDTYTYPVDGWYWFDSEEEAKQFFRV